MPARPHRIAATLVLALAATSLGACGTDSEPARSTSTAGAAEPTPSALAPQPTVAAPIAIVGERVTAAHWVNSSSLLTHRASATGDGDLVLPLAHAVGDWLDAHLSDLANGGPGKLAEVASRELLSAATPADLDAVTMALVPPGSTIERARYRLAGSYDVTTEWLEATVEVATVAAGTTTATLVFTPSDDGPRLVLLGPAATVATTGGA